MGSGALVLVWSHPQAIVPFISLCGPAAARRPLKGPYLLIRKELRDAQHTHAKLFSSPTSWPTGLAPLLTGSGLKF